MCLFSNAIDYSKDIFRNIRSIKKSQDLFDDLSTDPLDWEAANNLDIATHPELHNEQLIQRGFDYSKNDFLDYPFEHITNSRYSDGSFACWYGGESLEVTIHETSYHFIEEIKSAYDAFAEQKIISIDRRVALVSCQGIAFDLSGKVEDYPWLIDKENYIKCQEIGRRMSSEGHPLLRVPSARLRGARNIVAFKQQVLSNVRDFCNLQYSFDIKNHKLSVTRGSTPLKMQT